MDERSFLAGYKMGEYLARLAHVERGLSELRTEFDSLKAKGKRIAILAVLWVAALGTNGSVDQAAELVVAILRSASRN